MTGMNSWPTFSRTVIFASARCTGSRGGASTAVPAVVGWPAGSAGVASDAGGFAAGATLAAPPAHAVSAIARRPAVPIRRNMLPRYPGPPGVPPLVQVPPLIRISPVHRPHPDPASAAPTFLRGGDDLREPVEDLLRPLALGLDDDLLALAHVERQDLQDALAVDRVAAGRPRHRDVHRGLHRRLHERGRGPGVQPHLRRHPGLPLPHPLLLSL